MNRIGILICVFCVFGLLFGCSSKSAPNPTASPAPTLDAQTADTPQAAEGAQAADNPQAAEGAQGTDTPQAAKGAQATDTPQAADTPTPNDEPYAVNYKTHPEIRAEITKKDTEWGHIERTSLVWHDNIDIFYEIPVFHEKSPAFAKINQFMQAQKADFFSEGQMESALDYETQRQAQYPDETDKYLNTFELDKLQITDDYISFTLSRAWFMGGTNSYGQTPFTFNPQTGDPITLTDLYKKSPKDIQTLVIQAVKNNSFEGKDMINWDDLAKVKDFSFYIADGIPHVVFQKYEIAPGAAGAFDIPLPKP